MMTGAGLPISATQFAQDYLLANEREREISVDSKQGTEHRGVTAVRIRQDDKIRHD